MTLELLYIVLNLVTVQLNLIIINIILTNGTI